MYETLLHIFNLFYEKKVEILFVINSNPSISTIHSTASMKKEICAWIFSRITNPRQLLAFGCQFAKSGSDNVFWSNFTAKCFILFRYFHANAVFEEREGRILNLSQKLARKFIDLHQR